VVAGPAPGRQRYKRVTAPTTDAIAGLRILSTMDSPQPPTYHRCYIGRTGEATGMVDIKGVTHLTMPVSEVERMPGSLIRWHYLWYAALALAVMIVVIRSGDIWFLNFVHVFCGLLWTGIDLFMGFMLGPILRATDMSVRKAVLLRLTPRTLFLMPTLSIITGTTGWFIAQDLGFTALNWPDYGWVAAALALVTLMTIQGLGYLLPANLRVCLELQKDKPDNKRIAALTNHYFLAVAMQGAMQIITIIVMARFATGV
jgi:hypothetical protein